MNKELKKAIERLNKDKNKPLACGDITIVNIDDLEIVLNYTENSIPKEKVENIINPLIEQANNLYRQRCFTASNIYSIIITKIKERITRRKISHTTYEV